MSRPAGALSVLKRGASAAPDFKKGAVYTVVFAMISSLGSLLIPVLIQQVLDRGLGSGRGFRSSAIFWACGVAAVAIVLVYLAARTARGRMVTSSEHALRDLRVRTFAHVHSLSIAEQSRSRRGTMVARVTADVDTIGQFLEWGAISWITAPTILSGALVAMFVYSWQLALVVAAVIAPLVFVLRRLQRGLIAAYDRVRVTVSETLSQVAESIAGAPLIRAYGLRHAFHDRLARAVDDQYVAQMRAAAYQAVIFPVSDLFGAAGMAAAVGVGAWLGPEWGLTSGTLVAFVFLVGLFLQPLGELSETFDQTQTAVAALRKVTDVLDTPIDVIEPGPGVDLPVGPLDVVTEHIVFSYREGGPVLRGIDVRVPAGSRVAVVGETGCGKTTFAKLLCRLADPQEGRILLGGIDLRTVGAASRRRAIRMVPQDGFLFDASILDNVALGGEGIGEREVRAAFGELGLLQWLDRLPDGLETVVGERGERLSVGERQFVALARAQVSDPGLLILDEATSALDPGTERELSEALWRASEGRTTLVIAHRLSTAMSADVILVFDRGLIVERGTHDRLAVGDGVYARLWRSWLSRSDPAR